MSAPLRGAPPVGRLVFEDGLGKRLHLSRSGDDAFEVLWLNPALTGNPSFEFAVRERATRLADFREAYFARIRGVRRGASDSAPLLLVSDRTPGVRLAQLLAIAERRQVAVDLGTAMCLVRHLVAAIAMLHEYASEVAHGAIGPERIVITPDGRLVVVEHVLGAGLEQLHYSAEQYWQQVRVAIPPSSTDAPRFDQRVDVMQIGVVALSLLLGRPLLADEGPSHVGGILKSLSDPSTRGQGEPLPTGLRWWLSRALQLDGQTSFASALEAWAELGAILAQCDVSIPTTIDAFLARYNAAGGVQQVTGQPTVAASIVAPGPPTPTALTVRSHGEIPKPDVEVTPVTVVDNPRQVVLPTVLRSIGSSRSNWRRQLVIPILIVFAAVSGLAARHYLASPSSRTGRLLLNTNPPGADVTIDGKRRGVTPLTLALAAGPHLIEVQGNGESRAMPVTIVAGTDTSQYMELPKRESQMGQLEVTTSPPGAQISVDGIRLGASPMRLDLAVGEHTVVLESGQTSFTQHVTIKPATTDSLVVPFATAPPAPQVGWLAITAPVDVQVFERGQLLGTSQSRRIPMRVGDHSIELVNDVLGYRETRAVHVAPDQGTAMQIEFPMGTVALNAIPWAEVLIDGQRVGETPIGGLPVRAGPHEIVFRHPTLGEQRRAVTVTLTAPVRLSVDMTKKQD